MVLVFARIKSEIRRRWANRFPDSTAVYTDVPEEGDILLEKLQHGYPGRPEAKRIERAKRIVLLYSDDSLSLEFLSEHKQELSGKKVFVKANDIDLNLLRSLNDYESDVRFFSYHDTVARTYWLENNLYNQIVDRKQDEPYRIAIVGYGVVGKALFKRAFLTNLFSLNQKIEYHLWGCDCVEGSFLSSIDTMNNDRIIVHSCPVEQEIPEFEKMDRIVVADFADPLSLIQTLILYYPSSTIHCYHNGKHKYEVLFGLEKTVKTFGNMTDYLTEENIIDEKLLFNAKLFNFDYVFKTSKMAGTPDPEAIETEWNKLNGFLKDSNIARADFYQIEKRLEKEGKAGKEEIKEIEHIRWSRFHFINHWKYNEKRDNALRHHPCLVPYGDLPKEEKDKDDSLCHEIEIMMKDN